MIRFNLLGSWSYAGVGLREAAAPRSVLDPPRRAPV